jgi:HEXXH motif-containing protein
MTAFQLDADMFDRLAAGGGSVAAITRLHATQVSKNLLLIAHLVRQWPGDPAERDVVAGALARAQAASPERFGEVIGAPMVGAWAAIAGRAARHGRATPTDVAHLAAIAMVACARCGVDGSAVVPVRDGVAVLPGLGAALVGGTHAEVVVADGRIRVGTVEVTPVETGDWQPVRHLTGAAGGRRIRLALDDVDPYRHGHHAPPAPRLSAEEVEHWRRLFGDAWSMLAERLPERADELAAGLTALVPLQLADEGTARSATLRHAFGVFGLTRPPSAAEFAVTMVHEFQHSKLSAMLDVDVFSDPTDQGRYFAPWRTDPRPLAGLLQGVYAFIGVADTWRALRAVDGIGPTAEAQFAEARLQVDHGLRSLAGSGRLTPAGEALGVRLRHVADAMLAEPVSPAVARAAEQAFEQTWQAWTARHGMAV